MGLELYAYLQNVNAIYMPISKLLIYININYMWWLCITKWWWSMRQVSQVSQVTYSSRLTIPVNVKHKKGAISAFFNYPIDVHGLYFLKLTVTLGSLAVL